MPASPSNLELADPSSDISQRMDVGALLTVRLSEIRGTGYRWHHWLSEPGVLEYQEELADSQDNLPGGGGYRIFSFRALRCGQTFIQFSLQRAWETGPAIKSVRVTIEVTGPELR